MSVGNLPQLSRPRGTGLALALGLALWALIVGAAAVGVRLAPTLFT